MSILNGQDKPDPDEPGPGKPEPVPDEQKALPDTPAPPPADTPTTIRQMLSREPDPLTISYDITTMAIVKVVIAFFTVLVIIRVWKVFLLILFALMLAAALNPVVRRLQKVFTRTWAVVAILALILAILAGGMAVLVPSIYQQTVHLVQIAPEQTQRLQNLLAKHHIHVNLEREVNAYSTRFTSALPELLKVLTFATEAVAGFVVTLVMAIYILIEGPRLGSGLARLLPPDRRLSALEMVNQMSVAVGGYIRGQVIASVLFGIFALITLYALQIPDALALGALAASLDVLPLIGVLVAGGAAILMALTVSTNKALLVMGLYLVYHQLESHLIIPKIYGTTLNLSLTVIVISILLGAELLGLAGVVLALPTAAAIPSILSFLHEWQESRHAKTT